MKFVLQIDLDNEGMQSGNDIAGALNYISSRLSNVYGRMEIGEDGKVIDVNGNVVGDWIVVNAE